MTESLSPMPEIIQGGMGAGISDWRLARAVAMAGEKLHEPVLGVVSGTGLPAIMIGRLRNGDPNTKRALEEFDSALGLQIGQEIIQEYAPHDLKPQKESHRLFLPKPEFIVTGHDRIRTKMINLTVASAFAEVWLAKQGHSSSIGINVLEKIQLMHLPTLLGAMLAGVDYVLAGAGIPNQIPKLLDDFANSQPASYRLDVEGLREGLEMKLDPKPFVPEGKKLKRPKFLAIVSHDILAKYLADKVEVDGFVIEGPLAGGHNAPARGKQFDEKTGEPIYGDRDKPNLDEIKKLEKPFYLAGGFATSEKLKEARKLGASGIQVGTVFALCNESGMREDLKEQVRKKIAEGTLEVRTDPRISSTGFPFQVVLLPDTLSEEDIRKKREELCDLGYLVKAVKLPNHKIIFRCPAEPADNYIRKGGKREDKEGRGCICNGLSAAAGFPQGNEPPVVTLGKNLTPVKIIMGQGLNRGYSAEEVVIFLARKE